MVAPVTGPFQKLVQTPSYFLDKRSYRQKRPYVLPLGFTEDRRVVTGTINTSPSVTNQIIYSAPASVLTASLNGARRKLGELVKGNTSQLLAAYLERQQAISMITNSGLKLYEFAKSMRLLKPKEALAHLGLQATEKDQRRLTRTLDKRVSDAVLQVQFGWRPLLEDIGNAMTVLERPVPAQPIKAKHTETYADVFSPALLTTMTVRGRVRVTTGARVSVDNPNLYLANQLGVVNPAAALWEVTRFSFLVDYIIGIGDWLNSFSEFWGLSMQDPYYYTVDENTHDYHYYNSSIEHLVKYNGVRSVKQRVVGSLPEHTLSLQPWKLPIGRAMTSIALLDQQLHAIDKERYFEAVNMRRRARRSWQYTRWTSHDFTTSR